VTFHQCLEESREKIKIIKNLINSEREDINRLYEEHISS